MTEGPWQEGDVEALREKAEKTARDMCGREYGGTCELAAMAMTSLSAEDTGGGAEALFDLVCTPDCPFAGSLHRAIMLAARELREQRGLGSTDIEF